MTTPSLARSALRVAAWTAGLLLVPLLAMQLSAEMDWGIGDFMAAGALLFSAGMVYVVAARRCRSAAQRALVAAGVIAVTATVWAELAVGLFS
jgi:hypothetical protein